MADFISDFHSIHVTEYWNEGQQSVRILRIVLENMKIFQVLERLGSNMASKMATKHENHIYLQHFCST